ncbi:Protein phosphatase 2C 6 [Oleoguttula sp. CCFEE 5521]
MANKGQTESSSDLGRVDAADLIIEELRELMKAYCFTSTRMKHHGHPYSIRLALLSLFEHPTPSLTQRRAFHDYFVTHLPSSSLSPDKAGQHPKPLSATSKAPTKPTAPARDTTIVRIPLKSAHHHFGASTSRGSRPYNEDTFQAGTIELPAFALPRPKNLTRSPTSGAISDIRAANSESGDPQVFYFGVFDGHGGQECSEFLRERLHGYVEEAGVLFGMESSLRKRKDGEEGGSGEGGVMGEMDAEDLQKSLVGEWKETVGGYFKRFRPEWFPAVARRRSSDEGGSEGEVDNSSVQTVLSYAFLKADLDFTKAQASKHTETASGGKSMPTASSLDDPVLSDRPLGENDLLFDDSRPASQNLSHRLPARGASPNLATPIGGPKRFKGGSTASIALISTPTPTPFWNPASPSTLIVAHVGDTRILLCRTSDGKAVPLTTDHHPSAPIEATRLRRYAATFVTDSFGEERVLGLANTRAFGDIASKRIGVSAEPQLTLTQLAPAEHSFLVLISDGVSGPLSDQEVVDVVKEAKTPEMAAKELVKFAVDVKSEDADNATALVVRLGGWERRSEGGGGSIGTKEQRVWRLNDAMDPRRGRQ